MFEKATKYFLKKRVNKHKNGNDRDSSFINYKDVKTVILLFESDYTEKNPEIRRIIKSLEDDGKKVMAWGYLDKKVVTTAILPDFRILHHKNTDLFKKPKADFLTELENMEFDLLIDLSSQELITLQYVSLFANVRFKTGVKNNDLNTLDFMIDLESLLDVGNDQENEVDVTFIYNQIIYYLKSIDSKD